MAVTGLLRCSERAGEEAVAAADTEILRMQHHAVRRGVEAVDRADRRAGCVGAMHAGHGDRALADLAVVDCDDTAAIDAPRHVMLVLACGDAGVALDARSEEHTSELQSLMRIAYAVFCL